MLIEFSVSNFRSFREKQTFSMVAAPRLHKRENVFSPKIKGEKFFDLLKVAAVYGPNASGKSNLLKAMNVIRRIADSTPHVSNFIAVSPFRFDRELLDQPSNFEIHFVHEETRYQFDLSATSERIVRERLINFSAGKPAVLYERHYKEGVGDAYSFGDHLEGGDTLHQAWCRLTGPTSMFLSQAVANSNEDLKQLRVPFEWLTNRCTVIDVELPFFTNISEDLVKLNPKFANSVASFLDEIDVPVTSVRVEAIASSGSAPVSHKYLEGDINNLTQEFRSELRSKSKTTFTHRTALGDADFDLSEESQGTKGLVGFWAPWVLLSNQPRALSIIAIDELDSSLHPEIVVSLVKRHLNLEEPAQFIFTTHDTHLMDAKILRRDQFWLTERDINGATQLRSIHEFEGRESEDIEKRYYEGRYRGLPILRKG